MSYNGPIWIDPRFYRPDQQWWSWTKTTTTSTTTTSAPVDEDRIRKIVREEIADLPIPFDVPDEPPADA